MWKTLKVHLTTFLIFKHNKVITACVQMSTTKYYDQSIKDLEKCICQQVVGTVFKSLEVWSIGLCKVFVPVHGTTMEHQDI